MRIEWLLLLPLILRCAFADVGIEQGTVRLADGEPRQAVRVTAATVGRASL